MAGKVFTSVEEIDFYDRNGNEIEDSNGDSFEDEQKVINIHTDGGESYIDVGVSEDHPVWFHELLQEEEADSESETEAISEVHQQAEGFTSQAPIEEDEEYNPLTMGGATMDTQVIKYRS